MRTEIGAEMAPLRLLVACAMLVASCGQGGQLSADRAASWYTMPPAPCSVLSTPLAFAPVASATDRSGTALHWFGAYVAGTTAGIDVWARPSSVLPRITPVHATSVDLGRTWSTCSPMPPSGSRVRTTPFVYTPDAAAPACSTLVCLAGGFGALGEGEQGMTASVLCSRDDGRTWTEAPPLPWPAADMVMWQAGNSVVLAAGVRGSPLNGSASVVSLSIDPANCTAVGSWTDRGEWPLGPRSFPVAALTPGMANLGSHRVVVGGGVRLQLDASAPGGVYVALLSDLWSSAAPASVSALALSSFSLQFTATNGAPRTSLEFNVPFGEPSFAMREVYVYNVSVSMEALRPSGQPLDSSPGLVSLAIATPSGMAWLMTQSGPGLGTSPVALSLNVVYPRLRGALPELSTTTDPRLSRVGHFLAHPDRNRTAVVVSSVLASRVFHGYPLALCTTVCDEAGFMTPGCGLSPWDAPPCSACSVCPPHQLVLASCGMMNPFFGRDAVCRNCTRCRPDLFETRPCNVSAGMDSICSSNQGGGSTPSSSPFPSSSISDPAAVDASQLVLTSCLLGTLGFVIKLAARIPALHESSSAIRIVSVWPAAPVRSCSFAMSHLVAPAALECVTIVTVCAVVALGITFVLVAHTAALGGAVLVLQLTSLAWSTAHARSADTSLNKGRVEGHRREPLPWVGAKAPSYVPYPYLHSRCYAGMLFGRCSAAATPGMIDEAGLAATTLLRQAVVLDLPLLALLAGALQLANASLVSAVLSLQLLAIIADLVVLGLCLQLSRAAVLPPRNSQQRSPDAGLLALSPLYHQHAASQGGVRASLSAGAGALLMAPASSALPKDASTFSARVDVPALRASDSTAPSAASSDGTLTTADPAGRRPILVSLDDERGQTRPSAIASGSNGPADAGSGSDVSRSVESRGGLESGSTASSFDSTVHFLTLGEELLLARRGALQPGQHVYHRPSPAVSEDEDPGPVLADGPVRRAR